MLGYLGVDIPRPQWNIVDPAERPNVLKEIEATISRVALPYFRLFEDVDALVSRLEVIPIASFRPRSAVEWLLSHGLRDSALRHGRLILSDDAFRRNYMRAKKQIELGRSPHAGEAAELSYAALVYELDF